MCLAIPGRVTALETVEGVRMAKVAFGGVQKRICMEYTPEAGVGDYVLVHVGFALSWIDQAEAERTYRLLAELDQLDELEQGEEA